MNEKKLTRREFFGLTAIGIGVLASTDLLLVNPAYAGNDEGALSLQAALSGLRYEAHAANKGWLGAVSEGATAGTTGENRPLEAFSVSLTYNGASAIQYRAHVSDIGWMSWVNSGSIAGTTGQAKNLEAISIRLTGAAASSYNVYYRCHVMNLGWLGWASNGANAGSIGLAMPIQAIQIKIVAKGSAFSAGSLPLLEKPSLRYRAHVRNVGWQSYVNDNAVADYSR